MIVSPDPGAYAGVRNSSIHSIGPQPPQAGKAAWAAVKAACLALLLVLATACTRTPPEQALRETIAGMEAAAEARDAAAIAEVLAEDFDGPGGMDRERFRRYLAVLWLQHQDVGVVLGPISIELQEGHAQASFSAAVRGGQGRLFAGTAQAYQVKTAWRMQDGDWRLISASWEPVL